MHAFARPNPGRLLGQGTGVVCAWAGRPERQKRKPASRQRAELQELAARDAVTESLGPAQHSQHASPSNLEAIRSFIHSPGTVA